MRRKFRRIRQWLEPDEKLEHVIAEKRFFRCSERHILVITSQRLIKFKRRCGGRLEDESDKLSRQLVRVHLREGFRSSKLTLSFLSYDDSLLYHDPHHPEKSQFVGWDFTKLPKKRARAAYARLKAKERAWKETRRVEQLEHDKAMGGKFIQIEEIPPAHPQSESRQEPLPSEDANEAGTKAR